MRVALVFPGQGSQFRGMLDPWLQHTESKRVVDEASSILGIDLPAAARDPEALAQTDVVQPAVLACDLASLAVLRAEGVEPAVVAGHSLGEFAALVAAGAAEAAAVIEAVRDRARAMAKACAGRAGAMTAVMALDAADAADICAVAAGDDELVVANENSEHQTVLSGDAAAVERAEDEVRKRGATTIRLPVAGAFHSSLMAPALGWVAAAVARLDLKHPRCPVVTNVSGEATTDASVLEDLLCRQLVSSVQWRRAMGAMEGLGADLFIETGPADVLVKLVRRTIPGARTAVAGDPEQATAAAALATSNERAGGADDG